MKGTQSGANRGGPVNLRGIHYQLVVSFSEAATAVRVFQHSGEESNSESITLIVEPPGGGDSAVEYGGRRRVQQMKTSTSPWALARLTKALYDPYLASTSDENAAAAVELITDAALAPSARGLPDALQRLREVAANEGPAAAARVEFRSGRKSLSLLDYFCTKLKLGDDVDPVEHQRGVLQFLCKLLLRTEEDFAGHRDACIDLVRRHGSADPDKDIAAVVGWLLGHGKEGGASVTLAQIFERLGLARRGLDQWPFLCQLSRDQLIIDTARARIRYGIARGARASGPWSSILLPGAHTPKPLVFGGAPGMETTWLLARCAHHVADVGLPMQLVWLSSEQDPRRDLDQAASKFGNDIWLLDLPLPMSALARRIRERGSQIAEPWMVIFVDGVRAPRYLEQLIGLDPASLGVRVVVALSHGLAPQSELRSHIEYIEGKGFDPSEVVAFLESYGYSKLPAPDVRELLATPALAALFVEIYKAGGGWQPQNEYELVEQFWLRRFATPSPLSADAIAEIEAQRLLAATPSEGSVRPKRPAHWTAGQLRAAGLRQPELDALEASGAIRRDPQSRSYGCSHDRIRQWATAEGLYRLIAQGGLSAGDVATFCAEILYGERAAFGLFGYVPADLLWLLCDPATEAHFDATVDEILSKLEGHWRFPQQTRWLATLGGRVVPALSRGLRHDEGRRERHTYRDTLARIGGREVTRLAAELVLPGQGLAMLTTGVELLAELEHPGELERLWELHEQWWETVRSRPDERPEGASDAPSWYHLDISERALARSVAQRPEWLAGQLSSAPDLSDARSTLLFLLARSGARSVWLEHKDRLRGLLDDNSRRGFVRCVAAFRDEEEIPWLKDRANHQGDFVLPEVLRTLALLEPGAELAVVDPGARDVAWGRRWWLGPSLARQPDAAKVFLRDLVLSSEDPAGVLWDYTGFELWWDEPLLEVLVEWASGSLGRLTSSSVGPNEDPLFRPLSSLASCRRLAQLRGLWKIAPSLDRRLGAWLASLESSEARAESLGAREAADVLRLLAGPGAMEAGASILSRAVTWFEGQRGLDLCVRGATGLELEVIRARSLRPADPNSGSDGPVLQRLCTLALAYLGEYAGFARAVVEWGVALPSDFAGYVGWTREAGCPRPELLTTALESLEQRPIRPGSLLLLGIHGGPEGQRALGEISHEIPEDGSEKHLAYIVALDYAGAGTESVGIFLRGIDHANDRIRFACWGALVHRSKDPVAKKKLLDIARSAAGEWMRRSGYLLDDATTAKEAAELLWARRSEPGFLFCLGGRLDQFADFALPGLRDYLVGLAMRPAPLSGHARIATIRGLAKLDRPAAGRAILVLREERAGYELEWPHLVLETVDDPLEHLQAELREAPTLTRLFMVGEALRTAEQAESLDQWLGATDWQLREGACYALCATPCTPSRAAAVRRALDDPEESVREAAQLASEYLDKDREASALSEALSNEVDRARQWALVDAILSLGYPGLRGGFGQVCWYDPLVRDRPYYEQQYCRGSLERRRKALRQDFEKRDKGFRRSSW